MKQEDEQKRKDYEQRKIEDEQRKREYEQRKREYEQRKIEDEQAIAKLDAMILQTKKENERLAVLESKIDSSFSKHGINLPLAQTPEQP
ncbi:hypothetical protein AWQ21_10350 [Picosynechococcus sp. PCC 7003]|nr:hypothetical protein AWQ21_10350 [Picosynechococcus sp. PCC 7003]